MSGKLFIFKLVIFGVLNLLILTLLLYGVSGRHRDIHLPYAQTESNLLAIGKNEHYPVVFLGTSRGRVFSRDGNHEMVENILGKKVANLSKGGGGGLMPMDVHLSFFFNQGNTADHIIYLVDPFVFYSSINNENNDFFLRDEPFELFIFLKLIKDGYPVDRLSSYLQKITVTDWQKRSRYGAPGLTDGTLNKIDEEKMEKARKHYLEKCDQNSFTAYGHVVEDINRQAKAHGADITYVMLPLLMPDFPGLSEVDAFLRKTADRDASVSYINCSSRMQDKNFFYDHMHFNKTGIEYFLKRYIRPIL
nr:hypothetical protein [uncultured Desulfobacter sp.]